MSKIFHGTTRKHLPSILQYGVRGSDQSYVDRVYVSEVPDLPMDVAQITAESIGSEPVLLVIETKKRLNKDPEYPDEDFEPGYSRYIIGAIEPSEIKRVIVGTPSGYGDYIYEGY